MIQKQRMFSHCHSTEPYNGATTVKRTAIDSALHYRLFIDNSVSVCVINDTHQLSTRIQTRFVRKGIIVYIYVCTLCPVTPLGL